MGADSATGSEMEASMEFVFLFFSFFLFLLTIAGREDNR